MNPSLITSIALLIICSAISLYIIVKCLDLLQDIYVSFDHWNKKRIKRKLKINRIQIVKDRIEDLSDKQIKTLTKS